MGRSVEWIYLAQDRNKLRDLVNTAMNFKFYKRRGDLITR